MNCCSGLFASMRVTAALTNLARRAVTLRILNPSCQSPDYGRRV
jgi:hypothetical protein